LLGFMLLIGISAIFLTPMAARKMSEWGDGLCVSTRYQEAMTWYSRAAFLGNAHAQAMLANGYGHESKDWGIKTDWDAAVKWTKKAAAQNDAEAEYLMGAMYLSGRHLPKDLGQARYWAKKAIEEGVSGGHASGFRDYYIIFGKDYAKVVLRLIDEEEKGGPPSRSSPPAPTVQPSPTTTALSVDELEKAFKNDPKGTEALCKRVKGFSVTGTVDWVGAGLYDKKPAINLKGSGTAAHTTCSFPDSAKASVNALQVGQKVTVRAEFSGYLAGFISLKNCEVVR
jgi:TPR repeat protein